MALSPGNVASEDGPLAPPNEAIVQSNPCDELADIERGPGRGTKLDGSVASKDSKR